MLNCGCAWSRGQGQLRQSGGQSCTVPGNHPGGDSLPEYFARGFRDRLRRFGQVNGQVRLFASDVGPENTDEIQIVVPGGHHGWPNREGTFELIAGRGLAPGYPPEPPRATPISSLDPPTATWFGPDTQGAQTRRHPNPNW